MNQIAIDLYKTALEFAYVKVGKDHADTTFFQGVVAGKFAELMVQECLKQIDSIRDGCEEDGEDEQALGADWAGLAVARHFGVEK